MQTVQERQDLNSNEREVDIVAERIDASTLDIQETLVEINRVAKVVKG